MDDRYVCTECGVALPATASEGLCTKCLLKIGLQDVDRGHHLRVRCPHCRNPIELVDDAPLSDITCPSCDSKFSLVDDETVTKAHGETTRIGQFELIEQVGVGGFGAVWKARDLDLDRTVALKVPRRDQVSPSDVEQFMREARAAAQLKHPNIVGVHEVGRSENQVYIVSDFVDGATLADRLSVHQTSPRETAGLCAHLAAALHYAHQSGVIHRDLKPSNVMIDALGEPHIMDFGLAKREAGEIKVTVDGKILGTPAYMSPEQASGHGHDADPRSDVYSLGVILFEMLTGEKPFRGTSRMLLHQVIHDDAPQPRKLNSAVPRDLQTICLKCLEKQPKRRYNTAQDLADDLTRWLNGKAIWARPVSSLEKAWLWAQRRPDLAGSLLAVVVTLLIAGWVVIAQRAANDQRRADSLVEALLTAPPEAVPYAITSLHPFQRKAIGPLRTKLADEALAQPQRLHAAAALAEFGEPVEHLPGNWRRFRGADDTCIWPRMDANSRRLVSTCGRGRHT